MPERMKHAMGRVRHIHFVGIGGAGMSGIAEVLHNLGYQVSGSDRRETAVTHHLAAAGVDIMYGHSEDFITGADVIVVSSAVPGDNPEVAGALKQRIPVIRRAEMLAELMRFREGIAVAGTHGKTTTTSLVVSILAEAGLDPTYVIGGLLNSSGTHARLGAGRYLVAEADESDASFLHLTPVMAILTNIDADHLDTYQGDFTNLQNSFAEFINRLPFYGLAVLCADDSGAMEIVPALTKPFTTYGLECDADYRAAVTGCEAGRTRFTVDRRDQPGWLEVQLNLPGNHNVLNALAAIVVATELGISREHIARALSGFQGIARRCHIRGEVVIGRTKVLLVDDYAHHPGEIRAILSAIRSGWGARRQVVIFQPHRYTRTRDLFEDFCQVLSEADVLLVMDIYPAGETPLTGIDSRSLCRGIRMRGKVDPVYIEHRDQFRSILPDLLEDGDVVMTLGAGDIGSLGTDLVDG